MKTSKLKIIGILLALFVIAVGGVVYYASTKLNPEEIRKIAIEQTQKIFPNAKVELGEVSIGWGLNFKVEIKKLDITTENSNAPVNMASIDDMLIRVPLWAILTNGGVIEIQMDKPNIHYQEFSTGNNWTYAMGDMQKKPEAQSTDATEANAQNDKAIDLFSKSKVNVKLSNIQLSYLLQNKSSGNVNVSRFLIKGLNLKSPTAFEIASDAKFEMEDKSVVSFNTLAIGEINIADLLNNGSVTSLVIIKVSDIAKTGMAWKIPEITTNLNVLLTKEGNISGKVETVFETHNKISTDFNVSKSIQFSNINVDITLKDIGTILNLDRSIDLSKAKLVANGSVLYTEDKKIDADLSFKVNPAIGFTQDGLATSTVVEGSFKKKDIFVKSKTQAMEGTIEAVVNGEYDPNKEFNLYGLKPFDIKVSASKVKIPQKMIQDMLWGKKAKENAKVANDKAVATKPSDKAPELPGANVNVTWTDINVGGENFNGKGKIVVGRHSIAIDNMSFKFSKGSGGLTQTLTLGAKQNHSLFDLSITDLNLNSLRPFLPPFVENFQGTFSGKVNGTATMYKNDQAPNFDVNVALNAKNGEIKNFNLSDYINPILGKIPMLSSVAENKEVKLDGKFDLLNLAGRFTPATYALNSISFIGENKRVEIKGTGTIYPVVGSKNSAMDVYFTDNGSVGEMLLKNVGTRELPIRVEGPGFAMKPQIDFTLSRIAKSAAQTKGKEAVQKVIDKNLDKVVPEKAREQVKGLIDGLFKKKK